MREFVELQGASGATYRFRHWPRSDPHLPIAGNYVVIREADDGFAILALDVSDDLSLVPQSLKRPLREQAECQIYTRLNVSRATRVAEQEDIAAANKLRRLAQPPSEGSVASAG